MAEDFFRCTSQHLFRIAEAVGTIDLDRFRAELAVSEEVLAALRKQPDLLPENLRKLEDLVKITAATVEYQRTLRTLLDPSFFAALEALRRGTSVSATATEDSIGEGTKQG